MTRGRARTPPRDALPGPQAEWVDERASTLTLGGFIQYLESAVLELLTAPRGLDVPVAEVVVYDPLDPMEPHPGDIICGVGIVPGTQTDALLTSLAQARAAALVVKGSPGPAAQLIHGAEEAGVALFSVPTGSSWAQVVMLLRQAVSGGSFGNSGERFGGVAAGDLFAVANVVASLVDAPVTIEDSQSRVLAFSVGQEKADAARATTILGRQVPEHYIERLRKQGVFRTLAKQTAPVYVDNVDEEVRPRVAVAVRAGDAVIGSIWAVVDGPLTPEREAAFVDAASFVSLHLLRHQLQADTERALHSELVGTILKGGNLAREAAERLRLPESAYRILAVGVETDDDHDSDLMVSRCGELLSLHAAPFHRSAVTGVLAGVLYALVPVSGKPVHSLSTMAQLANSFVTRAEPVLRGKVLVGIGGYAATLGDVPQSRTEADQVLRVLRSRSGHPAVAEVSQVRTDVLLMRIADFCSSEPSLPGGPVALLREHDAHHHTAYVETLRAFLDAFGDVDCAAQTLSVHPNTVRYRLRQLQDVGGIDIRDRDQRLAVTLELSLESPLRRAVPPRPRETNSRRARR